jgi:formylglycine-generating enzyme required for sulfatase activity
MVACAATAVLVLLIGGAALLSRNMSGKAGDNSSAKVAAPDSAPRPQAKPPLASAPFSAEDAKEHQAQWAAYLNQPLELTNRIGMKLVLIPPGKFLQGSTTRQRDDAVENLPVAAQPLIRSETQREVTIDQPFWLSAHEVTVRDFRQFVQAMQYVTTAEKDRQGAERFNPETKITEQKPEFTWKHSEFVSEARLPVVGITLDDAQAFCQWLSRTNGRTYFIPSEAQWEYACRAGTATTWYWGDDPAQAEKYAWPSGRNAVGGKLPNAFGLFDMLGNAAEITLGQDNSAIARGGSPSGQTPWFYRSAGREPRSMANFWTGFRVAMSADLNNRSSAPK